MHSPQANALALPLACQWQMANVYSKYKGWIILDIFSSLIYNIGVILVYD